MKQTSRPADNGANPWEYSIDQDRLARPTVLLVEDDRDIREMMGTERIRQRTEGAGARGGRIIGGDDPKCPDPVELILYVSSQSPRSFAAVKSIRKVLERFNASRVKLTVCDLSENPEAGVDDAVAFTPTLVRRKPGPRTCILGHITSPELLLELLADCEAEMN